jgi:hypothetical protein
MLSCLVTPMAKASLAISRKRGLPVIDLSHTFDPNNERHYGTMSKSSQGWSGAEPSDISQVLYRTETQILQQNNFHFS